MLSVCVEKPPVDIVEKACTIESNKSIPTILKHKAQTTVNTKYTHHKDLIDCQNLWTTVSRSLLGILEWNKFIPPIPAKEKKDKTNKMVEKPPIHWSIPLQKSIPFGKSVTLEKIVDPLVTIPETDSKYASTNDSAEPDNINGIHENKEIVGQISTDKRIVVLVSIIDTDPLAVKINPMPANNDKPNENKNNLLID